MNRREAAQLCYFAKQACPAQAINEETPDAWFLLLQDLHFEDAQTALVTVARKQPFVAPAEIRGEVAKIRAARLHAFGPIPDPPDEVGEGPAYHAWLKDVKRAIGDGSVTKPEEVGRIQGPPSKRPLELEGVVPHVDAEPEPESQRTAIRNPEGGKAHRQHGPWQTTICKDTAAGYDFFVTLTERVPVEDVPEKDRCKRCWS